MTTFDTQWETVHQQKTWGKYPAEELVRFMSRTFKNQDPSKILVLDLGCGTGAGTWFLCQEGFDTHATDGSATAIKAAQSALSSHPNPPTLAVADAASQPYPDQHFDCIVDIGCLTANTTKGIEKILAEVSRLLKPKGHFFASHLFTKATTGSDTGQQLESNTRRNLTEGPLAHIGTIHFFRKCQIRRQWQKAGLAINSLDSLTRTDQNGTTKIVYHLVAAQKP
jgi:ubiquinone/menaquinone biosynthesis C-methylase UbiE